MIQILASVILAGSSQSYSTAPDFSSLLSMGLFPGNGGLQISKLFVAFPEDSAKYVATVRDAEKEYGSFPMGGDPVKDGAFAMLSPSGGANGVILVGKAGSFTLDIQKNGELMSSLDFTIRTVKTGDEFTGKTLYVFDGPWRKWAALMFKSGAENMHFRVWGATAETDSDKTLKISAEITQGGALVAKSYELVASSWAWKAFDFPFDRAGTNKAFLTSDFKKLSGNCEVVFKVNGEAKRRFPFTVKDGVPSMVEQGAMDYKPRTKHMLPRTIVNSSNDIMATAMHEVYWLSSSGK